MKIYVVTEGAYDNYRIITATPDKDLADAIAEKFYKGICEGPWVEEFEDAENLLKPCWFVWFDKDGSVTDIENRSDSAIYYEDINECKFDSTGKGNVCVIADDSVDATKIASEMRAQRLAEKAGIR